MVDHRPRKTTTYYPLKVTPIEQRQIGICLMEMAIYVAELFILPYGFVIAVLTFTYFSILF